MEAEARNIQDGSECASHIGDSRWETVAVVEPWRESSYQTWRVGIIALSTLMAFFAGITFLAFADRCRLGGETALVVFIAFNVMAMQLVRGLSTLQACARA